MTAHPDALLVARALPLASSSISKRGSSRSKDKGKSA